MQCCRSKRTFRARATSRGFGLVQVMLLIAVMAGLATMGYLQWRGREAVDSARQAKHALAQADAAIVAFATVMRRFPCPATERDGEEDCASTHQKGWLPTATLRLAGAELGIDARQLRYLVQRQGGANDLTVLTDTWRPLVYDEDEEKFFNMRGAGYPTDILTLTDFCQRLGAGGKAALTATMAQVNATPPRPIAYSLAHPGDLDADGDGDLFDGANVLASDHLMEDPERRPLLARYNDSVLERSYASLLSALQCLPLIDSINTVALAHDVASDVAEMRQDNIDSAKSAIRSNIISGSMTGLETALNVAEGISDTASAAAAFSGCAASLGLAVNLCAAAPLHATAAGLAVGVAAANAAVITANILSAEKARSALKLADGGASADQLCPPMDGTLNNERKKAAEDQVKQARQALAEAEHEVSVLTTQRVLSVAARDAAQNHLYAVARAGGATSGLDPYIDALRTAATGYDTAFSEYKPLDAKVEALKAEVERLRLAIARYQNPAQTIQELQSEIAQLESQIAGMSNGPAKKQLENELAGKKAELDLARNPDGLAAVRDSAIADRAQAQADLAAAISARDAKASQFSTAQTNYQSAYTALRTAAQRYEIGGGRYACMASYCQAGDTEVNTGAFDAALEGLFGAAYATSPIQETLQDGAKVYTFAPYLLPEMLQRKLDAMNQDGVDRAADALRDAQLELVAAQAAIDNPPPCNVTGSAVVPMTPDEAEAILIEVDRKGGTR